MAVADQVIGTSYGGLQGKDAGKLQVVTIFACEFISVDRVARGVRFCQCLARLLPLLEKKLGPMTFGRFLVVERTRLDLSQAEMARHLGISRARLCDLEKGRQLASVTLALKIAKKGNLSPRVAVASCLQDQLAKAKVHWKVDLVA